LKGGILVKRQVIIMVSIALISFLAGTLFSMSTTGLGIMSNPFQNQLNGTTKLQAEIDSLNASLIELQGKMKSALQIIRFQSPNEIFIPSESTDYTRYHTIAVANFTWTPKNGLSNAVLSAYFWAEFKSLTDMGVGIERRLTINGVQSDLTLPTYGNSVGNSSYRVSQFQSWMSNMLYPSSSYAIQYRITVAYADQVYVRNINVILVVVDGL
jgi:hypothetical protein